MKNDFCTELWQTFKLTLNKITTKSFNKNVQQNRKIDNHKGRIRYTT